MSQPEHLPAQRALQMAEYEDDFGLPGSQTESDLL